jgi:transketolase
MIISNEQAMRTVFGETLCQLGDRYPYLVVLDADVSSSTQTLLFGRQYPHRFYNFGIAEANMVSAAAGMATCGLMPLVSSFAFLLTLRAGDPVRSLIAYNRLNVKLAGGYAGLSDFADGASHQAIMDLAIMRAMPAMTVLVPSDIDTTRWATEAMLQHEGPVYLRLSRDLVGSCHDSRTQYTIGNAVTVRTGCDITLVVSGTLLPAAMAVADQLEVVGIEADLLEYHTLKPFDQATLVSSASRTGAVVSIEEHTIIGGLGGAVAETLSEHCPVRLKRLGIRDTFGESGAYHELLNRHRLSPDLMADEIIRWFGGLSKSI